MKDLAAQFLTENERDRIKNAVSEAEKSTSGEIVPLVVPASYDYPMADVMGGAAISLPSALLVTPVIGKWLWIGAYDMWLFLGLFIALFFLSHQIVKHTLWLKRWFISVKEIEEEVEEAAIVSFFSQGLYRTREGTGVLIFISVFEHRVWVLADHGINEKVDKERWNEIVRLIVTGIKGRSQAEAICKAVRQTGDLLKVHFPRRPDDKDELKNII